MMKTVLLQFLSLLSIWQAIADKSALRKDDLTGAVKKLDTVAGTAAWTYYSAYPNCCPGLANYDPNAPTDQCQYNRCNQAGQFYAIGTRSPEFVQTTDIVNFYDASDPSGKNFYSKYGDRYITVTGTCGGKSASFQALVADTCSDALCDGCCSKTMNKQTGYLISMEYNTMMRHFGAVDCGLTTKNIDFTIDTTQSLAIANCGAENGGTCTVAQTCCGADNFCRSGLASCGDGCQSNYGACAGLYSCGAINDASCGDSAAPCCSQYGYCAATKDACGSGCQSAYGSCDSSSSSVSGAMEKFTFAIALAFLPVFNFLLNLWK